MDDRLRLSELKLCEIVGVSQPYRQSLVKRKMLEPAPQSGCSPNDAVELAILERLGHHLSPSEVAVAWKQLRPRIRELVPKGRLDLVFSRELGGAELARDDASLRTAVIGGRPVRVLELGPRLQEVLDAFRRWAEAAPFTPPRQVPARSRSKSS
ncbi:MAG: hypothetical protein M3R70_03995 [Actinomycetota bacterium]|nr:hypothetical protein [Actinomycetota bacterium]